jgi:hypothetical protein
MTGSAHDRPRTWFAVPHALVVMLLVISRS